MLVVDTHVVIWDALKPELLSEKAREVMDEANEGDGILFCEISLWEIGMLINKGKLVLETGFTAFIELLLKSNRYILSRITPEIVSAAICLPPEIGDDPADRLICATAIANKANLLTSDLNLHNVEHVKTIW